MKAHFTLASVIDQLKPVSSWTEGETYSVTKGSYSAREMIILNVLIRDGVVIDACFQAHGSGYTILCCAELCAQLTGQVLTELVMSKEELALKCCLPREKYQVLLLLEEALAELRKRGEKNA